MFSPRTPHAALANRLSRALAARTRPTLDLTATNPTVQGIALGHEPLLGSLGDPRGAVYAPDPRGIPPAREAVAAYYARRGVAARADRVVLTASSSEAYGWLFKLLASPGDMVLVPAPSYPLLDALAELESVGLARYPLAPHDGWQVDPGAVADAVAAVERSGRRVAAVVVVGPNNPTGTSITPDALARLGTLAAAHGFAIVSDEVFLDYRYAPGGTVPVAAASDGEALVFSLGGLSKAAAFPQLKLGWILAAGPAQLLAEALERLEWIADAYLSVATPVQLALPRLLDAAPRAAAAVTERVLGNLALLRQAFPPGGEVTVADVPGGWSAVLRVPAVEPEEGLVLRLLEDHDVLVHPGYFFEFPFEAFLVLSLLPPPHTFRAGLSRLAAGLAAGAPTSSSSSPSASGSTSPAAEGVGRPGR